MRRGTRPLAAWTGVIVALVLPWLNFKSHTHWERVTWIPFSPPIRIRDIVLNILMYVPWGYFCERWMRNGTRRVATVVMLAAMLSLATEGSQLYSDRRFPSATDLTCNIIGAFAGAMFARSRTRGGTM